ncbi:MAG: hypothetical protein A2X46_15955 [Lentisphaerae bacterium GWF2_57_35]|nr:MAG: hypothetical protein A2X46_15955 [Lentisphaerae bacterium GWF2_57_35]
MGSDKIVALLPMKAHSERLADKNIRPFCGRPLYHHTLHALAAMTEVDEIVVDTDSELISMEAPILSPKVRIIERPVELRGDFVSMNRIIEHDLSRTDGSIFLQTHSTNPLIRSGTYALALRCFREAEGQDSLFSVNRYQSRFYDADMRPMNHQPGHLIRTQDLPPMFEENSCIYIFTKESFARSGARLGKSPRLFVTPRLESVDIDDEESWRLAELIGKTMTIHPD